MCSFTNKFKEQLDRKPERSIEREGYPSREGSACNPAIETFSTTQNPVFFLESLFYPPKTFNSIFLFRYY